MMGKGKNACGEINLTQAFFCFRHQYFRNVCPQIMNTLKAVRSGSRIRIYVLYLSLIAACAAASLAIGTRKGEQET